MTSAATAPRLGPGEVFQLVAQERHARGRPTLVVSPQATIGAPTPLTKARRAAGLSMTELARSVHVARTTVSVWERGDRGVAPHYWSALGAALGLGRDEIGSLFTGYPPARLDGIRLPSLARRRRAAGLTQRALADLLGVAPTTVSAWEIAGVPVPGITAARICQIVRAQLPCLIATPPAPGLDSRPLRHLRTAAGMSQREAAAHLGVAVGSLARYESGERRTPVAVLRRMADAYRRPLSELLKHGDCRVLPLPRGSRWRPEEVPAAITALRVAAGLTKAGLGRLTGRSGQAVLAWETGRYRPTTAVCRRIETVFGLPTGQLPY